MTFKPPQMMTDIPQILTNPIFIAIILTVLAAGSYFFERWLDQLHPTAPAPITFTSGRKSVTLRVEEILYVGDTQLPISRKYRETVQGLYS